MTDATAEAVNWALERAATIADEACPCGVGKKLAAEIRALKVTHEHVEYATPEELEEMDALERFAAARGPVAEANLRAIVAAAGPGEIASAPIAENAIAHEHDKGGPMIPVDGIYRATCTCGHVHVA